MNVTRHSIPKGDSIGMFNITLDNIHFLFSVQKRFRHFVPFPATHEGKGYPCEYCGKVFKSPQFKQYHESEHTGNYRFTCETCGKGFNEKRVYLKHVALH